MMRSFLALIFSCFAFVVLVHGEESSFSSWRCASHGGINVLYCYLCVNGVKCRYSDLSKEQTEEVGTGFCTAATLSHLAAKHGLILQPAELTMKELNSTPCPVIVHMDGESPQTGAFLLIISITNKHINYINGPSATIESMSPEDFRRVWSGIAMVPKASLRQSVIFCMIGFTVGLTLPLVFGLPIFKP